MDSSTASSCTGGTVAYSIPCNLFDFTSHRPVIAMINLCSSEAAMQAMQTERLIAAVLHELVHVLGFFGELYQLFIDNNGKLLGQQGVYKYLSPSSGASTSRSSTFAIITPNVVQAVRNIDSANACL